MTDDGRRYAIICGSRDRVPTRAEENEVCRILAERGITDVVHGGQRGTDRWAGRLARRLGLRVHEFPADWSHGGIAGPERNGKMAAFVAPTMDPICVTLVGGTGTESMRRAADAQGVEVIGVDPSDEERIERLWQVTAPHLCAGLVTRGDAVIDAAPVLRWCLGRLRGSLRGYFRRKGWRVCAVGPRIKEKCDAH